MIELVPFKELNYQVNSSFFTDKWLWLMNAEIVQAYWKLEPSYTFVARQSDVNEDYGFTWRPDRVVEALEALVRQAGYKVESSEVDKDHVSVTVSLTGRIPF